MLQCARVNCQTLRRRADDAGSRRLVLEIGSHRKKNAAT
jgi:hypothetical protein